MVEVHLLLVEGLFQPNKVQFLQDVPHLDRLSKRVGADRVEHQIVVRSHVLPQTLHDGDVGLAALVRVRLVAIDTQLFALLYVLDVQLERTIAGCLIDRDTIAHFANELADGQAGYLAGDVPQAVVKGTEPARVLIHPSRAEMQLLKEVLAVEGVFADDVGA
jgi:hypothetical protein